MRLEVLNGFKKHRFDPLKDDASRVPAEPGNYIICIRKKEAFPSQGFDILFKTLTAMPVIYIGKAEDSLRGRDLKEHFNGKAGRSTLRKSLGVLLELKLVPRDKNPASRKTTFQLEDELKISTWMKNNLVMFTYPNKDFEKLEKELIEEFHPPLNDTHNRASVNAEFRQHLKSLRSYRPVTISIGKSKAPKDTIDDRTKRLRSIEFSTPRAPKPLFPPILLSRNPFKNSFAWLLVLLVVCLLLFLKMRSLQSGGLLHW